MTKNENCMKLKTFASLCLPLAALVCSPAVYAGSANDTGFVFIDLNAGTAVWSANDDYDDNENDSSYGARAGYLWNVNSSNSIGLDLGYIDFGDINLSGYAGGYRASFNMGAKAKTVGVNYKLFFAADGHANGGFFGARAGYMNLTLDVNGSASDYNYRYTLAGSGDYGGAYVGLGIGYNFSSAFSLGLHYDYYTANVESETINLAVFSLGAEFRF